MIYFVATVAVKRKSVFNEIFAALRTLDGAFSVLIKNILDICCSVSVFGLKFKF